MPSSLLRLMLRAAVCLAVALAAWAWAGPWGLAPAIALAGAWLAGPLVDLAADTHRGAKALALRDIEGRHVEYRGRPLDVTEDDSGHRWVATAGLRRIVPGLPADAVLARIAPGALMRGDRRSGHRLEAEALLAVLARSGDAETHRFVRWVDREIVQPARRARGAPLGSPLGHADPKRRVDAGVAEGQGPALEARHGAPTAPSRADPVAPPPMRRG